MKHTDGLALREVDGDHYEERANLFSKRSPGFKGHVDSRLVRGAPGQEFEVCVQIEQAFVRGSCSGVKVIIAIGDKELIPLSLHNVQSWWIDRMNLQGEHKFKFFSTWKDGEHTAEATRFAMPKADYQYEEASQNVVWQETSNANAGCIAVFVVRGELDGIGKVRMLQDTDPPIAYRHELTGMPKVICHDWFKALAGEKGQPYIFEFRNTVTSPGIDAEHFTQLAATADIDIQPRAAASLLSASAIVFRGDTPDPDHSAEDLFEESVAELGLSGVQQASANEGRKLKTENPAACAIDVNHDPSSAAEGSSRVAGNIVSQAAPVRKRKAHPSQSGQQQVDVDLTLDDPIMSTKPAAAREASTVKRLKTAPSKEAVEDRLKQLQQEKINLRKRQNEIEREEQELLSQL